MQRRLRRAAPLLAAVALTGLVRQAPAQVSTYSGSRPQPVSFRVNESTAGAARLDEMQAELAWMTDEATFPCPLTAHAVGPYLLVSGSAPSATVKARALELAGQVCKLALKDSIRLQGGEPEPPTPTTPAALHEAAAKMLNKSFGTRTKSFEILALANGKLVVHGKIDSYEEKLAVSRYLRQLLGVTSIQNDLEVSAFLSQGRAVSRVTRDGKVVVAATGSAPQTASVPKSTVDEVKTVKTIPDKVVMPKGSTTTPPADANAWRGNGDGSVVSATTSVSSETPTPRVVYTSQTSDNTATASSGSHPKGLLSHLFGWNKKEDEAVAYPSSRMVPQGVESTVAVPSSGVTTAAGTGYSSRPGQITTVGDKSSTAKPTLPYVTNGVVLFEDDHSAPPPAAKHVALAAVHADFKQRVAALLGHQARDVEVVTGTDKMVVLRMTVNSEAVEKVVREKILRLPEMQTATMRMEITISPQ